MNLHNLDWTMLLLGYPVLLLSLSFHECAHAWTADRYGDPTARLLGRVSMNPVVHMDIWGTVVFPIVAILTHLPLFGWAKPVPVNPLHLRNASRDNMLVSLAGPLSNIVLGGVFFLVLLAGSVTGVLYTLPLNIVRPVVAILQIGLFLNILLAFFNLIPVPPLDGSHILEFFLPYNMRARYDMIKPYGFLILIVLLLGGGLDIMLAPVRWIVTFLLGLV